MTKKETSESEKPKLSKEQETALATHLTTIEKCKSNETANFQALANAFFQIQEFKLYLYGDFKKESAFFKAKLGYSYQHSQRLMNEGRLLNRLVDSPAGENVVKLFTGDRHMRPLLKYDAAKQDAAIDLAQRWMEWAGTTELSSKLMEAAVVFLNPPERPKSEESESAKLADQFRELVEKEKTKLPEKTDKSILKVFDNLAKQALALGGPRRTTGIGWTDATWNPLQGCTRVSKGCDNCYAAREVATRRKYIYPGLAKVLENGKCVFTGKIQLLPERLAEPLLHKPPTRYFVNSVSDLFHKGVLEEFIDAVFTVMEMASWHEFQVLTKRPERMSNYTQKRYKDRQPPANIWLGTSTEDQSTFDERYRHLKNTKAAVCWLSVEPLLSTINFRKMAGIDWVVVGGESGEGRREVPVEDILNVADQCNTAGIPVYVKQDWAGKPGKKGRIPDEYWEMKQYPKVKDK